MIIRPGTLVFLKKEALITESPFSGLAVVKRTSPVGKLSVETEKGITECKKEKVIPLCENCRLFTVSEFDLKRALKENSTEIFMNLIHIIANVQEQLENLQKKY